MASDTKTQQSLKGMLEEIIKKQDKLIEQKKARKFILPWKAKLNRKRLKDGLITVAYINENKEIDFIRVPVFEGSVMIKGAPYIATSEYMLTYKGKPMILINAASAEPYSPSKHLEDSEKKNLSQRGYRILLNSMKSEAIKPKRKISLGFIVGSLVALLVLYYVLSNGGIGGII